MAKIFAFSPFGYEGALVSVEADLRRGIPVVDIVGLADGAVKESRERVIAATRNSGFEFPVERVLISLSSADLKKEGSGFDLAVALAVMNARGDSGFTDENILVLGELELSGKIRSVRGIHAAVSTAVSAGIRYAVVPAANAEEAKAIAGIKVFGAESLSDAVYAVKDVSLFNDEKCEETFKKDVTFTENREFAKIVSGMKIPEKLSRIIEIAVAGKHNLLITGSPGCGKTMAVQTLVPLLTPSLTKEEAQSVTRIWSLAGLLHPDESLVKAPPFRMPHQTATIEGICGGGPNCRPGEISLAHNGVLFLDEAAEFRTSVLQMLRVPVESRTITLSRAGRSTTYPAGFQLIMAANPCPCGNYGSKDRICLCSARAVDLYWKKFSAPLLDCIELFCSLDGGEESKSLDIEGMKNHIKKAFEIQRARGMHNSRLNPYEISQSAKLDDESLHFFDSYAEKNDIGIRREANILKVSLTIANMDGRERISKSDVTEALSYSKVFSLAD